MGLPAFFMIDGAPTPVAPFSHAVECDGWVFVTGQMPTWPDDDSRNTTSTDSLPPGPSSTAATTCRHVAA